MVYDYARAESFVRDYLSLPGANLTKSGKTFPFRDRFEHTLRVRTWCMRLADAEADRLEIDRELLYLAATLHDVGYAVDRTAHAAESAKICRDELPKLGYPAELCSRAAELIALHSAKALPSEELPPELQILQDADSLDELGAMRVSWVLMEYRIDEGEGTTFAGAADAVARDAAKLRSKAYIAKTVSGAEWYEKLLREEETFAEALRMEVYYE